MTNAKSLGKGFFLRIYYLRGRVSLGISTLKDFLDIFITSYSLRVSIETLTSTFVRLRRRHLAISNATQVRIHNNPRIDHHSDVNIVPIISPTGQKMLLELCVVVGGVIFYKNRKKRRAEEAARQEWYNSGRTQSPPVPQGYPPYNDNYNPPTSPSMQKPPVVYGNSQHQQPMSPHGQPVMAGPEHAGYSGGGDVPPAYATLRPQSQGLGYERQGFHDGAGRDQKGAGRS